MINIRKLAALDMVLLGTRFIVVEYAVRVLLPLILGGLSLRASLFGPVPSTWETVLGVWLVSIAANYAPLLIYAVTLARSGAAQLEGQPELAHVKRYRIQQAVVMIPLMVVVLTLLQEARRG